MDDRTVTPDGFNLRTRVHEYGGRAHAFVGAIRVFANFFDQALYRQSLAGDGHSRHGIGHRTGKSGGLQM